MSKEREKTIESLKNDIEVYNMLIKDIMNFTPNKYAAERLKSYKLSIFQLNNQIKLLSK